MPPPRKFALLACLAALPPAGCVTSYPLTATPLVTPFTARGDEVGQAGAPYRRHVYLFAVNGCDLRDLTKLCGLRPFLASAGYCNVYLGPQTDRDRLGTELQQIAAGDPAARFVVLGVGSGADDAVALASTAAANGAAVDTLILVHPRSADGVVPAALGIRTICLSPGRGQVPVPSAPGATMPRTRPLTTAADTLAEPYILKALSNSAGRVILQPVAGPGAMLPAIPRPAPTPLRADTPDGTDLRRAVGAVAGPAVAVMPEPSGATVPVSYESDPEP